MTESFDTEQLVPSDRAAAVKEFFELSGAAAEVPQDTAISDFYFRTQSSALGRDVDIFRSETSGLHLRRTFRHVADNALDTIDVNVQLSGERIARSDQGNVRVGTGQLYLTDLSRPYDYRCCGEGAVFVVSLPHQSLGLSPDIVRQAASRIHESHLYELVRRHALMLNTLAPSLAAHSSSAMVGSATTDLVRAMLVSVGGGAQRDNIMQETLIARILAYLHQHLKERELTPARIAHHHGVSIRHLYKLWSLRQDVGLAEWIILQRLQGARGDLEMPNAFSKTISAVARDWGFADTTHFSHRFRRAYGLSPREWRQVAAGPRIDRDPRDSNPQPAE